MTPSDLLENEVRAAEEGRPESPTNALRATLNLIASLTAGKTCKDCSVTNRLAGEGVRRGE